MYHNTLTLAKEKVVLTLYHIDQIQKLEGSDNTLVIELILSLGFKEHEVKTVVDIFNEHIAKAEELKGKVKPPRPSQQKKQVASSFIEFMLGLNASQICFELANYDLDKAKKMYYEIDFRIVTEAFTTYTDKEFHKVTADFESRVVGFGGSLDGGKGGGNVQVIHSEDIDPDEEISFKF